MCIRDRVQRATATFRWTGSWHTVFVTVDRRGGQPMDNPLRDSLRQFLERFRMAGHDVEVEGPTYVPMELGLTVCVAPNHRASQVRQAILDVLSNRDLPDGRRGLFHPDNLTFGQVVFLSPLVAAVRGLDGVASVQVDTFQRQSVPSTAGIAAGKLTFERLEIPRLDNDPDFPDRGLLRLNLRGGL